jgi:hypothetical protein
LPLKPTDEIPGLRTPPHYQLESFWDTGEKKKPQTEIKEIMRLDKESISLFLRLGKVNI